MNANWTERHWLVDAWLIGSGIGAWVGLTIVFVKDVLL